MTETIDQGHDIPVYSPVCTFCRHFHQDAEDRQCDAFPDAIPLVIWQGENRHRDPFPGDHGIQFEPLSEKP